MICSDSKPSNGGAGSRLRELMWLLFGDAELVGDDADVNLNVALIVGLLDKLGDEASPVLFDELAANVLLLLGGIVIVVLVSWVRVDRSINELGEGITDLGQWGRIWLWLLRVPVLFVLVVSLVLALFGFYEELEAFFFNN